MSEVAKRLRDRRMNVWNEARAFVETAAEENREMTAEENGTGAAAHGGTRHDRREDRRRPEAEQRSRTPTPRSTRSPASGRERRGSRGTRPSRTAATRTLRCGRSCGATQGAPRAMELRHNRALGPLNFRTLQSNTGTPTSVVPTDFYDRLIAHLIEVSAGSCRPGRRC